MKVYIDLIIVINFIYDLLILLSVSTLLKRKTKVIRLLLSSLIGEASILQLFISISATTLLIFKIVLSLTMVYLAFGKKNFLENIFYFYVITIIIGGCQYLIKGNNYTINIVTMLIISPIIITLYIKSSNEIKIKYEKMHDVLIIDGEEVLKINAYMDTGNTLIDPITKLPVIMISSDLNLVGKKKFYVPYEVINYKSILTCIKVDKVIVNNRKLNVLLGLCDKSLFKSGYQAILNENIREMI